MNLPVRVPKTTEAAALGGAIQALWALENRKKPAPAGGRQGIGALTDAHVALEGGATIKPDAKSVRAYDAAYEVYSRYLGALSPLYK
jgi:xylulokinase